MVDRIGLRKFCNANESSLEKLFGFWEEKFNLKNVSNINGTSYQKSIYAKSQKTLLRSKSAE